MRDYSRTPMAGMSDEDYETLLVHLGEQLAAVMRREGWPEDEAPKAASDALASAWQDTMTANEWLADAGRRLGVSTESCVGA